MQAFNMGHSTYLMLNVLSIAFPLLLSFDKKVAFYKSWAGLFKGILITGLFFVVWDVAFTYFGVWSFNPTYLLGIWVGNLPLEEVLFFVCVPYASVFIYRCYEAYFTWKPGVHFSLRLTQVLGLGLLLLAIFSYGKAYTFYNALFGGLFLVYHGFIKKTQWMGTFWMAYLIHLIPFLLVNGVLTALPVVVYNDAENLGMRLGTIPIEDTVYALTLLLGPITVMEKRN